jgi:hypothetical protein
MQCAFQLSATAFCRRHWKRIGLGGSDVHSRETLSCVAGQSRYWLGSRCLAATLIMGYVGGMSCFLRSV